LSPQPLAEAGLSCADFDARDRSHWSERCSKPAAARIDGPALLSTHPEPGRRINVLAAA
jgi:hypothetical protein